MTDQANGKADAQTPPADDESFGDQLSMMRRAFMTSPLRNTLFTLAGGMLAIILATAFGQILLNRWNEPFYDALSRRDLAGVPRPARRVLPTSPAGCSCSTSRSAGSARCSSSSCAKG